MLQLHTHTHICVYYPLCIIFSNSWISDDDDDPDESRTVFLLFFWFLYFLCCCCYFFCERIILSEKKKIRRDKDSLFELEKYVCLKIKTINSQKRKESYTEILQVCRILFFIFVWHQIYFLFSPIVSALWKWILFVELLKRRKKDYILSAL